ncbi:hypothetical protein P4K49_29640 [Bacillus cereus]|uniref:hypothetical protein n=1 Tax=Bacillus thuringiensis TaxID=1428 RepID=UPI000676E47D|nr:hypothetical protein [Bacillus thuringiensis]MEB8879725.1 hypothetical protein [Bacillus cereus]AKR38498.1 Hypothetical protein NF53_p2006 [Bacillus thuringiensis serovar indiana]MBG9642299.1 hypothetical protein [Bacillus thuringiensis]MBG9642358.1 hypothetical protein [Bacillus thuringiensis]MBG9649134.1 hypothetical protein [Bacillus thuringiensis]
MYDAIQWNAADYIPECDLKGDVHVTREEMIILLTLNSNYSEEYLNTCSDEQITNLYNDKCGN